MGCAFVTSPQSWNLSRVYSEGGESWRAGEPGNSLILNFKIVHLKKLCLRYGHFSPEVLVS